MGCPETVDEGRYNRGSDITLAKPPILGLYVVGDLPPPPSTLRLLWIIPGIIPERPLVPYRRQRVSACSHIYPRCLFLAHHRLTRSACFPFYRQAPSYISQIRSFVILYPSSRPQTGIVRLSPRFTCPS